jgi:hypothetical protein
MATGRQSARADVDRTLTWEPGEPCEITLPGPPPSQACGTRRPAGASGTPEETGMWPTWNTVFRWWKHGMQVGLIAAVVCVSACAAPGRSGSTPAALSPDAGQAGAVGSGDGGNGY